MTTEPAVEPIDRIIPPYIESSINEYKFRHSAVVKRLIHELNLGFFEMVSTTALVEYVLGFYLFPDMPDKFLRSSLYTSSRKIAIDTFYKQGPSQFTTNENTDVWKYLVTYLGNSYDPVLTQLYQTLVSKEAKDQYEMGKVLDKVEIHYVGSNHWNLSIIATLLTLATLYIRGDWTLYWNRLNGIITGSVKSGRENLVQKYPQLHAEIIYSLLNIVRS